MAKDIDYSQVQWEPIESRGYNDVQWEPIEQNQAAPTPKKDVSALERIRDTGLGIAYGAARGARESIPLAKDISAWSRAYLGNPLTGEAASGDFTREKETVQKQQETARKTAPKSFLAGEIAPYFTPIGRAGTAANLLTKGEQIVASKVAPYVGALGSRAIGAGTVGAGLGAVQGFGEGTDLSSRMQNAKSNALLGGAFGAALPAAGSMLTGIAGTAAEQAASRLSKAMPGVNVSIPASVASENPIMRGVSAALGAFPFTKSIIDRGVAKGVSQLEEATRNIPGIAKPGLSQQQAGEAAAQSLRDWVNVEQKHAQSPAWDYVKHLVDPKIVTPLSNTQKVVGEIGSERLAAKLQDPQGKAVGLVLNALKDPNGLTYEGMQRLKREVGSKIKGIMTESDLDQPELEMLYNALRKDTRASAVNAGGKDAGIAFDRAVTNSKEIIAKRKELGRIIGLKGDVYDEGVFKKLAGYATEGGNEKLLKTAQSAMSPQSWNNVTSGIIEHLGKTKEGHFSPDLFVTKYGSMGAANRDTVFGKVGTELRDAMDDINTVAQRYKEAGKTRNFSNTALALSGILGLGAIASEGFEQGATHDALVGASTIPLAYIMSKPRMVRAITQYLATPNPQTIKQARAVAAAELRHATAPKAAGYSPVAAQDREERASGGRLDNRDYPAKRLTRMERAVKRARDAIALETKPLMEQPDHVVARALELATNK